VFFVLGLFRLYLPVLWCFCVVVPLLKSNLSVFFVLFFSLGLSLVLFFVLGVFLIIPGEMEVFSGFFQWKLWFGVSLIYIIINHIDNK